MELSCFIPVRRTWPSLLFYPEASISRSPKTRASNPKGIELSSSSANNSSKATNDVQLKSATSAASYKIASEFGTPDELEELQGGKGDCFRVSEELRKEAEKTLEWELICEQVSRFASTSTSRALCRNGGLRVGRDRDESQRLLDQTAAAVLLPQPLDFSGIEDISEFVRLAVSGEVLSVRELCSVERSLSSARRLYEQLVEFVAGEGSPDRYEPLLEMLRNCNFMTELVHNIGFCIDSNLSIILDQASSKLESIRSERWKNTNNLESLLKSISSRIFQAGGIDSPLITKRRSRMCVGIRASHKSLLPDGIVLGVSSSGATYFMEPREVMELNNREVKLSNSEKAEEVAILSKLTSQLACSETEILYLMSRIQELDLASARGAHAAWINGLCPIFTEAHDGIRSNKDQDMLLVDIEGIRHPLLLEPSLRDLPLTAAIESKSSSQDGRDKPMESKELAKSETVVPLDIKIKHTTKVVVISGPNTGGKTVTMKTLGLAALMAKAGLFLPATRHPRLPWFDQVLADIGDHQSLEHNLSTFSGHVSRLCKILEVASRQSLVLIDEIGNGTDPSEGVALSISILKHLVDHVNLAMVTTHYADLSLLKSKDSRFENAAMEFCIETLQPTYLILWGSTGNSNALNIARSIGFNQKVLGRAQEWVEKLLPDKQKERQGFLYQSLLEERNVLEAQAKKAASVLSEVKKLYLEIYSEAEDLERREASLKSKELQSVRQEIKVVKSQMHIVVENFEKQLKSANPTQFNALMKQAEASVNSIVEAQGSNDDLSSGETSSSISYAPQIGDQVHVKKLGDKLATVVAVPGDDSSALVQYGKVKIHVKRNDMKLVKSSTKNVPKRSATHVKRQGQREDLKRSLDEETDGGGISFGPAVQTSKNTVDLRGMRVEEASSCLNMAISGCRSYGVLFVIHGMGTGAVKECALDILRKHPRVAKFEEESPMNYGCTVAYIT